MLANSWIVIAFTRRSLLREKVSSNLIVNQALVDIVTSLLFAPVKAAATLAWRYSPSLDAFIIRRTIAGFDLDIGGPATQV